MTLEILFGVLLPSSLPSAAVRVLFAALLAYVVHRYLLPLALHYRNCVDLTARACSSPRHWFYGHLKLFSNDDRGLDNLVSERMRLKGTCVTWFGPLKVFVDPLSPTTLAKVLYSGAPKDDLIYGLVRPWIGDGLLVSSGEKWRRNRKLLTPAFHFNVLKPCATVYNECARVLVGKWRRGHQHAIDVTGDVAQMTMDVMLRCAMSTKSNCQLDAGQHRYVRAVSELAELTATRAYQPLMHVDWIYWLSPAGRRFRRASNYVHTEGERMIRQRKEELERESTREDQGTLDNESPPRKYLDFIDILLRSKDERGRGLSIKEIRDEVDTFLFEGHDTTTSGISWLLYNLSRHPDYQRRCREEVMRIMGDKKEIKWDDLHQLAYLDMCIKESLRLHPPVPTIARKLNENTTFVDKDVPGGRLEVEAGTSSLIHIVVVHRSTALWENPELYDPERFSPENVAKRDPLAFVAFSAGSRNCIGKTFAMCEIKVTLCHVLRNFRLSVDGECPAPQMRQGLVLRSANGVHLKLESLGC